VVSARTFWAFLGVLAVVGLLGYGLLSKGANTLEIGQSIPDRTLPALAGGGSGNIAAYRGRWVLVNLWASWCTPCRDESPELETFYRAERRHGFTVLGIDSQEISTDGLRFVRDYGLTYPQLHDGPGDLSDELGTRGYPESFLVDPRGRLALIRRGPVTPDYLRSTVLPLIREGSRS
jgi:cytochrome c biogenesis protein CcmG/thiol:disulfide interchange protein DsbE